MNYKKYCQVSQQNHWIFISSLFVSKVQVHSKFKAEITTKCIIEFINMENKYKKKKKLGKDTAKESYKYWNLWISKVNPIICSFLMQINLKLIESLCICVWTHVGTSLVLLATPAAVAYVRYANYLLIGLLIMTKKIGNLWDNLQF